MALEEQLDAAAEHPEGAVVLALDRVAALAGRPVDAVLGLELGRRRGSPGAGRGSSSGSSARIACAQLVEPLAGRRGDGEDVERVGAGAACATP